MLKWLELQRENAATLLQDVLLRKIQEEESKRSVMMLMRRWGAENLQALVRCKAGEMVLKLELARKSAAERVQTSLRRIWAENEKKARVIALEREENAAILQDALRRKLAAGKAKLCVMAMRRKWAAETLQACCRRHGVERERGAMMLQDIVRCKLAVEEVKVQMVALMRVWSGKISQMPAAYHTWYMN